MNADKCEARAPSDVAGRPVLCGLIRDHWPRTHRGTYDWSPPGMTGAMYWNLPPEAPWPKVSA